jgi:hypothetical protein
VLEPVVARYRNKMPQGAIMPGPIQFVPTARVLFYRDSSDTNLIAVSPGGKLRRQEGEFGLRIVKDSLEASFFPQTTVDLVNRFWILDADGRIPPELRAEEGAGPADARVPPQVR